MQDNNEHNINFTEWQLQSELGTIVSFLLLLKKNARGMILLTIYFLFKFSWYQYFWIIIGWVLLIVILGLFAYLSYKNIRYKIDPDRNEFLLNKGIINKTQNIIQLDNIIQVNIDQSFIQRLAGVYSVEIETAGSGKNEAIIEALDKEVAFALKESLLKDKQEVNVENTKETNYVNQSLDISDKTNILAIGPWQLIKYAFTADYARSVLILLGISISFFSRILEYVGQFYDYEENVESLFYYIYDSSHFIIICLAIIIIAIFFNGIRNVFTYFQMKLKIEDQSTWISYGLFARKNTVLQNNRTQTFTIQKNYFQQLLNVEKIQIEQTSNNIDTDKKAKIKIVGIEPEQSRELFAQVFDKPYQLPPIYQKSNPRWMILPFNILIVVPFLILTILIYIGAIPFWAIYAMGVYAVLMTLSIRFYWKNYSLFVDNNFLVKRTKFWTIKDQWIPIDKVQSIYVQQYFWHRRLGIGNIVITTAGGDMNFRMADYSHILALSNYLLFRIEQK